MACRGTTAPYLILFVIQMMTHKNQFVVLCTQDYDVQVLHVPVNWGTNVIDGLQHNMSEEHVASIVTLE
jgi:hypothetical protein